MSDVGSEKERLCFGLLDSKLGNTESEVDEEAVLESLRWKDEWGGELAVLNSV